MNKPTDKQIEAWATEYTKLCDKCLAGQGEFPPSLSQFIAEKYAQHMIDQCLAEAGILVA